MIVDAFFYDYQMESKTIKEITEIEQAVELLKASQYRDRFGKM